MSAGQGPDEGVSQPVLRVVKGDATPEEIAALVAVVSATGAPAPTAPPVRSPWARPRPRSIGTPGPGAWRASALPR